MKLRFKLFFSFLTIILIAVGVGIFFIFRLNSISKIVKKELPPIIKDLSESSYLNNLSQIIRYDDEALTQSARNYAFTGDKKWKDRYDSIVVELDKKIKEAISRGDNADKVFFQTIDESNLALVALEEQSFALVENGQAKEAIALLEGDDYWREKEIYSQGLAGYLSRRDQVYDQTYSTSTSSLNNVLLKIENNIAANTIIFIISIIIGVIIGLLVSWLTINFITENLFKIKNTAEEISKGNLNKRIIIDTKDEFSDLADSFNNMANNLKDSLVGIEKKVAARTDDLEKINRTMIGRELKMMELKKEINELKNNK